MAGDVLVGREQIAAFVGRGWKIISGWIKDRGFPAVKLDGQWESDTELIRQWRHDQIKREA